MALCVYSLGPYLKLLIRCLLKESEGGRGGGTEGGKEEEREPGLGHREQDLLGIDLFCVRTPS